MKKHILLIATILIVFQAGFSQNRSVLKANKTYDQFSYIKAINIYERIAEKNPANASADIYKKLGNSYYFNADYKSASKWYGKLIDLKDANTEPDYIYRYAQTLKALEDYVQSDNLMQQFNASNGSEIRAKLFKEQEQYLEVIKFQSGRYDIESFPLNSIHSDFAPSVNEKQLIFSSSRDTGRYAKRRHTWNEEPFLDLYTTSIEDNFSSANKLSKKINTKLHESTSTFTKDGKTVYFTRNNSKQKKGRNSQNINKLKLYSATINEDKGEWKKIKELPFNSNAFSSAHPALSPDEKTLYFASDREGSIGQSDIYKVTINDDGTFGTPENLGDKINTEGRESFPFISSEGNLYFSSDGHPGLGGLDVYVTDLKDVPGNVYNVGEPINSTNDDFTFIINDETKKGYFATNRTGGVGSDDIYLLTEKKSIKETYEKEVSGVITDIDENEILSEAIVSIIDENNVIVESVTADASGKYTLLLDLTKDHTIRVSKKDYGTEESFVEKEFNNEDITLNFKLVKEVIKVTTGDDLAKLLRLNPIYFDVDKSFVRRDAEIELAKILATMEEYPNLKIDVRSYTDSRASNNYNVKLSNRRSKSVIAYLVAKGINEFRFIGRGYGEAQLVNKCSNGVNCSKIEHELNRRSEFIIVSNE